MDFCSREKAIERINALGAQERPFLFVIDYSTEHSYVSLLEDINPDEVLYSFPSWSNDSAELERYGVESVIQSKRTQSMSSMPIKIHEMPAYESPAHESQRMETRSREVQNSDTQSGEVCDKVIWEISPETAETYRRKLDIIQRHQQAGNSFLANLTCRIPVRTNLSLKEIYLRSEAMYKLWFRSHLVCFSPEIFVRIENGIISGYPMKGTIDASLPGASQKLMDDEKEAAEHAPIVDLIRNDLSRVASAVHVPRYRYIDLLHTNKGDILQTSSRIEGKLADDYRSHIGDILFSQLPAGSITGAPKRRTVEIIREAEDYDRGFYTGVMGICCDGSLESAVMIRYVEQEKDGLVFKAGGGITAQSRWKSEYEEVMQKAYVPIY